MVLQARRRQPDADEGHTGSSTRAWQSARGGVRPRRGVDFTDTPVTRLTDCHGLAKRPPAFRSPIGELKPPTEVAEEGRCRPTADRTAPLGGDLKQRRDTGL